MEKLNHIIEFVYKYKIETSTFCPNHLFSAQYK